MHIFTLLDRRAFSFSSIKDFASQTQRHGFFTTLTCSINHPAHCQSSSTIRTHFYRHLVGSTTYTSGLNLNHGTQSFECFLKRFDGIVIGFFGNLSQSTVYNTLRYRFLAAFHHMVDELGQPCTAEFGIRDNFPFCCNSSSRHR